MKVEQPAVMTYQQIREEILQSSTDVKTKYPSILQSAIKEQDTELIDYLLQNNTDVNIASESDEPALNLAIRANNPELVKKIIPLVAGLDVKSYDYGEDYEKWPKYYPFGKKLHDMQNQIFAQFNQCKKPPKPKPKGTALELAITVGNIEIIDMLLTAGASIDPADGIRPLHWSIALNKYEIAEYLIKRGADINAISDHKDPMHVAIKKGHKEIVELLISHKANIDGLDSAVQNNHFEIVKILLDAGAEINPVESCPPLLKAVVLKNFEIAEYLINRGADINIQYSETTAVHLALLRNHQEMLEMLIKYKANLDINTSKGLPIHLAIERGSLKFIKILLKAGADLDAPTHHSTMSKFALSRYKEHIFDFFLDIGIDFRKDSYLDLITSGSRSAEHITKIKHHIIKLKAANFFVEPGNLLFIESELINEFGNKCSAEIELMKNTEIDCTSVSYYDVLHKKKEELAAVLQSVGEKIGVTEPELREKFPLYGGWVCYRLEYEQGKNLGD